MSDEDFGREPPWPVAHEWGEMFDCSRCGETVQPYWRHYWPPCRKCNVWSFFGVQFFAYIGLNAREWLYCGARPWCPDCDGTGYRPCQPQDLSILRLSGNCQVCGAYSFKLVHATADEHGDIEGSARHYDDDEADHEVIIGSAPLVKVLDETLTRAS